MKSGSIETPASLRFRMPGEWEKHAATWLAWPHNPEDWPDKLAIDLGANPRLRIAQWAANHGVTREYAWRSFYRSFGVAPVQFRSQMNTRAALLALVRSNEPLSKVAVDCGFSDQSHMTRAIKSLIGIPPARCRSSHLFKTN